MQTLFDLVTMAVFAGLVVLFLQRSAAPDPRDHMYQYAPAAIGCAVADFLGDRGQRLGDGALVILAWALVAGVVGYVLWVLRPFTGAPPR